MQISADWLVKLDDECCTDPGLVGAKAAQLYRLASAGFPIPEARVLTLNAFHAHLSDAAPDTPAPPRPVLQPALREALQTAAAELVCEQHPYLAVRSSALGEDGIDHSFAGQHATYYYVTADGIEKAVIDCWLSLWSEPAAAYRRRVTEQSGGFGMPVIVQRMVQAEKSGVCFTRDPTGAQPQQMLIEATWGLGAALVDGRVSPDRYRLDPSGRLIEKRIGLKRLKVSEQLPDPDSGRLEPVPAAQQSMAVLDATELEQLADRARAAETLFGAPQDVEWSIHDGELYILQSRPITALPGLSQPGTVDGRRVLFKPVVENISEALTPMTTDLFRRVLPPFGEFIHGRYYVDVDKLAELLPLQMTDTELKEMLLLRQNVRDPQIDWRTLPKAGGLMLLAYLSTGIDWHRTARAPLDRLHEFADRCDAMLADESVDPLTALQQLFLNPNPLAPVSELAFQVNVSAGRYILLTDLLTRLLARWAPGYDAAALALLTSGGEEMISQQMVEAVRALAAVATEDAALRQQLLDAEPPDVQMLLRDLGEQHSFVQAFAAFLKRFGHRAIKELELMTPRWREDPSTPLRMIRNYLRPGADTSRRIDPHGLRLAARDQLHQALPVRWQRWIVDRLLQRIRHYVTVRENTRYYHTMAFAVVRAKLKQWETRLIDAQRLRCIDDIFFLHWPELAALEAGTLDWPDVESLVATRRRRYRQLCELPAVASFNMGPSTPADDDGDLLRGDCASPGIAEGVARVILDPAAGMDLEPGEILVAPYTDPAWTPLFPGAGAVIVEVGSFLSHAGTLAREYQIPCLVDVADATRRLRSGQRLRVNAGEGWVRILEADA